MIFSNRFIQSKIFFMETMINLNDLLKHEIMDLYSVEEQIIEAMPAMIEKAKNPELKKALREHLKITEEQKSRLDKIKQTFGEGDGDGNGENKGFFSRLFGGGSGGEKCKGMAGIISEGEKIMSADITEEALDAAIIASAQKIEHYEICGYGTAREFAKTLGMDEVYNLLTQTLNEEYNADDSLTALARRKVNDQAEVADGLDDRRKSSRESRTGGGGSSKGGSKSSGGSSSKNSSKGGASKNSSKGGSSKGGSKSSGGGRGGSSSSESGSSKGGKKSGGGSSKGSGSKSTSKGGSSKGGSKSSAGRGGSSKVGGSKGGSKGSTKDGSSRGGNKSGGGRGGSKGSSKGGSSRGRGR
jgi:ferritin-like metal-binding protein YciE